MKRVCEILAACALLALTLPLLAIVGLMIKWESPGPVFEHCERVGVGSRRHKLMRFRILVRQGQGISPVGQFIRYTRIADLPQLINVLRGDMALFNSGPERPHFLDYSLDG